MTSDRIEDFLDRFSAASQAGNAASFAALFVEDATYVTCQGRWVRGRDQIARMHDDPSQAMGLQMTPRSVRALGPAVRLVVAEGGVGEVQTFTLILRAGRWVCAAFHNTAMSEWEAAE
jgi:uncharacterized protein (TIGR02246 family)